MYPLHALHEEIPPSLLRASEEVPVFGEELIIKQQCVHKPAHLWKIRLEADTKENLRFLRICIVYVVGSADGKYDSV